MLRNSEVVALAPKTVEVLVALIESGGKLITKQEILDKVWANTFVEEANLTHHISALRKALGEDKNGRKFIETISRRGYRFVAPINERENGAAEIVVSERITQRVIEEVEIETSAADDAAEKIGEPERKQISSAPPSISHSRFWIFFISTGVLSAVLIGFAVFQNAWRRGVQNNPAHDAPISYVSVSDGKVIGVTTISPDGKFAAYIQNYNDDEGGTIFIRQLETNREMRLLEPDERTFGNIDFSPDSSLIYYVSFEKNSKIGAIYSISILGGTPKRLFNLDSSSAVFAVSPDNKQIAFYRNNRPLAK